MTKSLRFLLYVLAIGLHLTTAAAQGENLATDLPDISHEIDNIQSKINTLEVGEGDNNHLKLLELYKRTLAYLKEADNYTTKSAEFNEALNSSADQTNLVQEALAREKNALTTNESEITAAISIQQLEQRIAQQQAERFAAGNRLSELANRVASEQSRPKNIQLELAELQHELAQLQQSPKAAESIVISEAQQVEQESHRRMLTSHVDMLQQELLSHEMRLQLLTAQRNLAAQQVAQSEFREKRLQEIVNQRRSELAERLSLDVNQAAGEASGKPLFIREATEQNARLSQQFAQLTIRIEEAIDRREAATAQLRQLEQRFRYTRQQLEIAGDAGILGEVLRSEATYLADFRRSRDEIAELRREIAQAGLDRLEIEKQRVGLADEERRLKQNLLLPLQAATSEPQRQLLRSELQQLQQDRGELLAALTDANNSYLQVLQSMDGELEQLTDTADRFSVLIDKRLLWVSSTAKIGFSWATDLGHSFNWFFSSSTWTDIVGTLLREARNRLALTVLVLLSVAGLLGGRRRMSRRLDSTARYIGNVQSDRISYTFEAIGITLLFAAPWPLLMIYGGWLLEHPLAARGELSAAAGRGLFAAGAVMYLLSAYRWLVKNRGVAQIHFAWSDQSRHVAWRNLQWFLIVAVPLAFVIFTAETQDDELHRAAIGRLAFVCASIAMTLFAWRTLRPHKGAITTSSANELNGWFWNARHILLPLAVAVPIVLILLALTGYYYTALRLETRLILTLMGVFENFVFYNLLTRWLLVAERRLALARARAKRSEAQVASASKQVVDASGDAVPEELDVPEVTLQSISEQSRVLIRLITALGLLLTFWWAWADLLPALGVLEDVTLWSYQATTDGIQQLVPITLKHLGLAIVTLLLTFTTARNLPALFELTVLSKLSSTPGTRYAAIKLSRYVIVVAGTLVALNLIGFHWEQIQWLVAALGIGLGFGLQEVVMNFVSGLIILVERPIRVGDTVTVGGVSGTVSQIRIRATTIVDWDNKALVVPNKTFITDQLINWTLTGPVTRVVIKVGIAYGSDTELAHRALMEVATTHPLVLEDPAPTVFFLEFGDSALLFELRVFVFDRLQRLPLIDDLHMAIDRTFREQGIEIAFPQLDVRVRPESAVT